MHEEARDQPLTAVETQLSADGGWWWNGADWVPAISPDGLWQWDGNQWRTAVELDGAEPAGVVAAVDGLLDVRFAEGGHLLALRAHEWRPRTAELGELVAQAAPLAARLSALDTQLAGFEGGRQGLRGLLGGGEREQLEQEAAAIERELRPLAALIGRTAPQPSLKDADEILVPARRLHERLLELQQALAEEQRLRKEQEERVSAARADLERARAERDSAVADIEERVRAREAEHERAVTELAAALRTLRIPIAGAPLARFQGLTVYENRIDTPDGRGPLDGARAVLGSAAELAEREEALVGELWLLEASSAARLHDAVATGTDERFVLVETRRVASAQAVPTGAEADAEAFVAALESAVGEGRARRKEWQARVSAAEAALQAALADTGAVDEARADLERASHDPERARPVEEAEGRLAEAERAGPDLEGATERVRALVDDLLRPPAPLRAAPGT